MVHSTAISDSGVHEEEVKESRYRDRLHEKESGMEDRAVVCWNGHAMLFCRSFYQ